MGRKERIAARAAAATKAATKVTAPAPAPARARRARAVAPARQADEQRAFDAQTDPQLFRDEKARQRAIAELTKK
jgi:hypothetical protein